MSFFIELIESTDENRRELEALSTVQDMLNGQFSSERYVQLLLKLYPIVLHFCPIMAAAASRCGTEYAEVRNHLYAHINEEKGHEHMVLDDLASFDYSPESAMKASPSFSVQSMLAYNYYMADRSHPCSVLGMVYVLEIISSVYGGQVASSVSNSLDRPLTSGFSFLSSHSSMDMEHMAKLRTLFHTIESSSLQKMLAESIKMNFYLIMQIVKDK
jgi:hypothetical protein